MKHTRLLVAAVTVCSVCMVPEPTLAQADEARRELQVQLPSSAQQEAVIHGTAAQGTQFSREILEQARISEDALANGRVSAVFDGNSVVVNRANLQELAVPGRVLIEHSAVDVANVAAPRSLMADQPAAKTYKLSWRVITPQGDWDAWVRDSTGLIFDGPRTSFAGEFDVALVNPGNTADRTRLDGPVVVAVAAPGASSIEPKPLEIASLGQWHGVEITVPNPGSESYEVRVSADPGRDGDPISMPVARPEISLTPTPRSITGWGIGKSDVEVQVIGVRDPDGLKVGLESRNGTLSQGFVTLDSQGKGSVGLRSSRHAGTTVSVADRRFRSEPARVVFEAPWLYLALAVGGGLIAAFLKGRGQHHWIRALATGALTGAVMALIYSVGINWLGTVFPDADIAKGGEAIVLVLGFAGAYLGVGVAMPKEE